MLSKIDSGDKREKAISACLDQFVKKGLYETTSRDLSKALKLQSGGMYSYFSNKDEAVLICAEEAILLLEKYLLEHSLKCLNEPDALLDELVNRAEKLAHMMRFLAQVCSASKYSDGMKPALDRLNQRYKNYIKQMSECLNCPASEFEPYFYLCVSAISDYMIFGGKENLMPQIQIVKQAVKKCLNGGDDGK